MKNSTAMICTIVGFALICVVISLRLSQSKKCQAITDEHAEVLKTIPEITIVQAWQYQQAYTEKCNCWDNVLMSKQELEKSTDKFLED